MTQVLIIGAGPTGLALANELARQKINFRIIDQTTTTCQQSRAIAVQARTLELFERFGDVSNQLLQKGVQLQQGKIYSNGSLLAQIHLHNIQSRYPFVLSLPQYDTEAILTSHLNQQGAQVEMGCELLSFSVNDDQTINAEILHHQNQQKETIQADYLIACDGAHSSIRKQLNLNFAGSTFNDQTFVLADIQLNRPLTANEIQVFIQQGKLAVCFPLPNEHFRIIAEQPKTTETVDIQCLQNLMHQLIANDLEIKQVAWFSEFRINQRKVKQYQIGHVFLVGDAAHIHSPAGGQGMNTGMQDAINLGWKLAMVLNKQAKDSLLNTYHQERSHVGDDLLRNTDMATRMMMTKNKILITLRNCLLALAPKMNFVQTKIINTISELAVNYRKVGLSSETFHSSHEFAAGNRWPDAEIQLGQISSRWYQQLSSTQFNLLIIADDKTNLYDLLANELAAYKTQLKWFVLGDNAPITSKQDITFISDPNHEWQTKLSSQTPAIYLLRPDFYIAYRAAPLNVAKLKQYLDNYLCAITY